MHKISASTQISFVLQENIKPLKEEILKHQKKNEIKSRKTA